MILEDFATKPVVPPAPLQDQADRFDQGYREGWEDAASAIKADDLRLGSRVAAHLQSLAHNHANAMSMCLSQIEPLLAELFDKILPRAADRSFLPLLLQETESLLRGDQEQVITLHISPDALGPLQTLLETAEASVEQIRIEPTSELDPLQARIEHLGGEREIDLARVLDALDDSFETYTSGNERLSDG